MRSPRESAPGDVTLPGKRCQPLLLRGYIRYIRPITRACNSPRFSFYCMRQRRRLDMDKPHINAISSVLVLAVVCAAAGASCGGSGAQETTASGSGGMG